MKEPKASVPTIPPLLKFFVGLDLTVELKNGQKFRGTLDSSDDFMNLVLACAVRGYHHSCNVSNSSIDTRESSSHEEFNMLHIRGASIRYVLFPDRADLPKLIKTGLDRERHARERYARGKRAAN